MNLVVRPAAETDLAAARDWYEQRGAGLICARCRPRGTRHRAPSVSLRAVTLRFTTPSPRFTRSVRRVLLRRFPYKVFYQVIDSRIVIFRVLHAKQDHGSGLS